MSQPEKNSEVPARMWDEDSPMPNALTMTTGDRQDGERTYVAVDALLTDEAVEAVIDYASTWALGEDEDTKEREHTRGALRAAIAHATQEATDAH